MTNSKTFAENTIVAFHIGRGGRHWNPGFLTFIGNEKIGKYTNDLYEIYENANEVSKKIGDRENIKEVFERAIFSDEAAIERLKKIGLDLGEVIYADCNGNPVGLTELDVIAGIGRIDLDGQFDTTYTTYLSDCSESELRAIVEATCYVNSDIIDYAKEQLGLVDETE